jgi:glycosyltransferase involved in cell wall biosynthesis
MIEYKSVFKKNIFIAAPGKSKDDISSMKFTHRLSVDISQNLGKVYYFNVVTTRSPYGFIKQIYDLRRHLKKTNPDLVVSHWGGFTGLTVLMASFGFKRLITYHGPDLNWDLSRSFAANLIVIYISKIISRFYDSVISVSSKLDRIHYGKNSHVIPMPVDTNHFKPLDKALVREPLGFAKDEKLVVFICGNDPVGKGLEMAIEINKIAKQHGSYRLLIYDKLIPYSDIPKFISLADCLIFLSFREVSPNIIREACACNIPVVSVDVGDVAEVLSGLSNCYIAERTAENVNFAIMRVLSSTEPNVIREKIIESNDIHLKKILEVYKFHMDN